MIYWHPAIKKSKYQWWCLRRFLYPNGRGRRNNDSSDMGGADKWRGFKEDQQNLGSVRYGRRRSGGLSQLGYRREIEKTLVLQGISDFFAMDNR